MSATVGLAASYTAVAVIEGASPVELQQAADAWFDAHLANEVLSIELTPDGGRLLLLVVYRRERRVRRQ